jgi:hypothetical protein
MSLSFYDCAGKEEAMVYEGVIPDGLTHTVRKQAGTCLNIHDAHLRLNFKLIKHTFFAPLLIIAKRLARASQKRKWRPSHCHKF